MTGSLIVILPLLLFKVEAKNVLFLLADDAGFESKVYLNPVVQTPNIDLLAKNSLIFNGAYTSVSSCSPSRSAILTGLPAHQNGMYGLHNGVHNFDSLSSVVSLPNILSKNGIRTGLIGKKHVGPLKNYKFDFEVSENNLSTLQIGRNISLIKEVVREFLKKKNEQFFLYVGFHDPHRCGHEHPEFGNFCERFGNGEEGMGTIVDWKPVIYRPEDVIVPYHVQDTLAARQDIAAQYTTISRLDSGIGLVLNELALAGVLNETLVIYTSDNGIPFPAGRTNLYDSGMAVPFLISSPIKGQRRNEVSYFPTSLTDIAPTVLDWFELPKGKLMRGQSLLKVLEKEPTETDRPIFASHSLHEVTMYYPMRAVRTKNFKLIHNLNYKMPFPIDQDFFLSPSFQELLNNTKLKKPTFWYRNLHNYYYRSEWELYNLRMDPEETNNIAEQAEVSDTLKKMKALLKNWQWETKDPWLCSPGAVLEGGVCFDLDNFIDLESNSVI